MNNNYANILKAGFDIEIRSTRFSMARMYLTLNGLRTFDLVHFSGGHFNAAVLLEKAKTTRKNTHLDRAMNELVSTHAVATALKIAQEQEKLNANLPAPIFEARKQTVKI